MATSSSNPFSINVTDATIWIVNTGGGRDFTSIQAALDNPLMQDGDIIEIEAASGTSELIEEALFVSGHGTPGVYSTLRGRAGHSIPMRGSSKRNPRAAPGA